MNLFLIERDALDVGYDENAGFVIYADWEMTVRKIAAAAAGDEGEGPWFDADRSTIKWLGDSGPVPREPGIVLCDYHAG